MYLACVDQKEVIDSLPLGIYVVSDEAYIYVGPQISTRPVLALEPILAPVLELEPHSSQFHTDPPKFQLILIGDHFD